MNEAEIVAQYPTSLLRAIIADLGKRNLRDYSDHATRWMGDRLKACRAELRSRQGKPARTTAKR